MPEAIFGAYAEAVRRAQINLERVMALTGARQDGSYFILKARNGRVFYISSNWLADADSRHTTCYYLSPSLEGGGTPWQEKIATALLSLYNKPENFDRWFERTEVTI